MEVKVIEAKSILTLSKLPDCDYSINPYVGCRFACTYCYASFMGRMVGKSVADWGEYVYVKVNAPELLEKELKKLENKGKGKTILFSSVTDPYQGAEAKYEITRQCLEALLKFGFRGEISILTKSNLILRDVDILKNFKHVSIGVTITTTSDNISRYFEKFAPASSIRLKTLAELNKLGFETYAFVGPLLPHFVANEGALDELFKSIAETGTKDVFVEHINLSKYILDRLKSEMKDLDKQQLEKFYESKNEDYRKALDDMVAKLVKKYKLNIMLGSTIYHKELKKKK